VWITTICTSTREVLVVHRNAPLSETGRLRLARYVVDDGWAAAPGRGTVPGLYRHGRVIGVAAALAALLAYSFDILHAQRARAQ